MKYLILISLLVAGCASNQAKNYECYRVIGPQKAEAMSQEAAEDYARRTDDGTNGGFFNNTSKLDYQCEEIIPKPRIMDNRR